jgi:hypothetical protein
VVIDLKIFSEELDKGFGEGPLTIGIFCTKCNAQFELNHQAVTMAMATNTSFLEYLRYVQSSKCPACGKEENDN